MSWTWSTKIGNCGNALNKVDMRSESLVQSRVFLRRINVLRAAVCFEDLRNVPGHFHELNQDRKGQWGFDLNGPYRLIVTPLNRPIPLDGCNGYDWSAIKGAVVVEIVNYHKEGER